MKYLVISAFILLQICGSVNAQEKAEQFDEYGRITCEDLLARTQAFGQRLQKTPSLRGIIITYNGAKSLTWQPQFVHRVLIGYYGNALNVTFYDGSDDDKPRTQVWLVPAGATFEVDRFLQTLSIPFNPTQTLKFDTESGDPCSGRALLGFLEMLKTTNSTGRIMLVNYPPSERLAAISLYREDLKKAGIALERVRFGYKTRKGTHLTDGYVEYWLFPKAAQ